MKSVCHDKTVVRQRYDECHIINGFLVGFKGEIWSRGLKKIEFQ